MITSFQLDKQGGVDPKGGRGEPSGGPQHFDELVKMLIKTYCTFDYLLTLCQGQPLIVTTVSSERVPQHINIQFSWDDIAPGWDQM